MLDICVVLVLVPVCISKGDLSSDGFLWSKFSDFQMKKYKLTLKTISSSCQKIWNCVGGWFDPNQIDSYDYFTSVMNITFSHQMNLKSYVYIMSLCWFVSVDVCQLFFHQTFSTWDFENDFRWHSTTHQYLFSEGKLGIVFLEEHL